MKTKAIEIEKQLINSKKFVINLSESENDNIVDPLFKEWLPNIIKEAYDNDFIICFIVNHSFSVPTVFVDSIIDNNITQCFCPIEEELSDVFVLKIKNWFKENKIRFKKNSCYFVFNQTGLEFSKFWNELNDKVFFQKTTIFLSNIADNIEQVFFLDYFTVFLTIDVGEEETGDLKTAKKVTQCLIKDEPNNWDFDRINYEFFSFLESKVSN